MNELIVLLDLETSGLDAGDHVILECGIVIANMDFEIVAAKSWFVDHDVNWKYIDVKVNNMHEKRHPSQGYGYSLKELLIKARQDNKLLQPEQVANRAIGWMESFGIEAESHALTGSTISFDRGFLKQHMPDLDKFFDYHSVDVSSISQMMKMFNIVGSLNQPVDRKIHRSIPDCEDSLKKYQWCVDTILEGRTNGNSDGGSSSLAGGGLLSGIDTGAERSSDSEGIETLQEADGSTQ